MKIKYESWLSGILGVDEECISLDPHSNLTFETLKKSLSRRDGRFGSIFKHENVIFAARDGEIIGNNTPINNDDTLTLFSPIAGG